MSKRVYMVTLHTGNTLTVNSRKFVRGRTVIVDDENLISYLKGHPNFTIVAKTVGDTEQVVADEINKQPEESKEETGGANTAADLASGMSTKTTVTNVAKNPAPVRRSGRAVTPVSAEQ